ARGMEPAAVALLRRLASADLYEVTLAPGEASVRRSTAALVNSFVTYHLGKPLKSWDLVPR
ncbi:MAG TPA: DNA repair protein RecO C-terminal domain-containing protein, partial [Egibacteraceae bacterium]|nr:DNA repair protein RecO C-terminal domain-containing protein [Egibacteraceae bacterium]